MANPIADSLLAVLSGLIPAHVATASARGQENRQTQLGIISANRTASERAAELKQRKSEAQATQEFRTQTLTNQAEEAKATARFRADQLDLEKGQILDKAEFQRMQQDYENKSALLNLQIEGLRNELGLAHQRQGEIADKGLYKKLLAEGTIAILKNPDITGLMDVVDEKGKRQKVSSQEYRLYLLKQSLDAVFPGVSGSGEAGGGANAQEAQSLIDSFNNPAGAPGGPTLNLPPLGQYPTSPIGGGTYFNPTSSDFEFNLQVLK